MGIPRRSQARESCFKRWRKKNCWASFPGI
jgi:hypothetical protein